jgi:hypothetical protein
VTPAVVAPSGPTTAQLEARKRAAAKLAARKRAAAKLAARKRAREAKRVAQQAKPVAVVPRAQTGTSKNAGFSDPESGTSQALPFLLAGLLGGALLLGVAITPARAVPSRVSRALDDRRQELALLGGLGVVATGFFFLLAMVSSA